MRFSTGLPRLDDALGGGILTKSITLIYGQEKSGKTSLVLRILASAARAASAAYVDCSGKLHPERLSQVLEANRVESDRVYVTSVDNFLQQEEIILKLHDGGAPAPLIIFDDFTYLHRMELTGNVREDTRVYKRLAFQLAALKEAALNWDLAVIVVGQVHSIPESGEARAVARRILGYWADYVLRVSREPGKKFSTISFEKPFRDRVVRFRVVRSGVSPL